MKPKELFDRLVKRDGYVMYNNQGLITFDKKQNCVFQDNIKNLYVKLVDEFIPYVFSKDEINNIEVKIDDAILTSPTDYEIEAFGQIDEDTAAEIKGRFPDLPDIVGWFAYAVAFTDNIFYGLSVGEHTLIITANDESASGIIVIPADPN